MVNSNVFRSGVWFLTSITVALNTYAQKPSDLGQMREYFRSIAGGPYIYLQGANSDMTVGTLMAEIDGTQFFVRRPESCFGPAIIKSLVAGAGKVEPINVNRTAHLDLNIGLNATRLGAVTSDVQAEFEKKGAKSVDIKYGTLTRTVLEIDKLKQQIQEGMDAGCKASFLSRKGHRYIIVENLSATDFTVKFTNSTGSDVSLSAKLFSILFPSFKAKTEGEITGEQEIKASEPLIVAIKTIKPKSLDKFAGGALELDSGAPDSFYRVFDQATVSGVK